MNLEQALTVTGLKQDWEPRETKWTDRQSVTRMVFAMAEKMGEAYQNISEQDWGKKWLPSQNFVLMEIRPSAVAVPYVNRIAGDKLQAILASSEEQIQPIVVDLNKVGIGKTNGGFTPRVIVVDGKHRHRAQVLRGKDRIMAWVGDLALMEMKTREQNKRPLQMKASTDEQMGFYSRGDSTARLYAAIAPPAGGMTRQDTGDGGARPTGGTRMTARGGGLGGGSGMNPSRQGLYGQVGGPGARSTGQLDDADPSDTKIPPDPSDTGTFVDPSDRRNWNGKNPQLCAPGCSKEHEHKFGTPGKDAPGAGGSYTRLQDTGAHNSEQSNPALLKAMRTLPGMTPGGGGGGGFAQRGGTFRLPAGGGAPVHALPGRTGRLDAGPIKVKKIVTRDKKKKTMSAVAPKGWEGTVKKMKDHPEITNPYALSYYMKDKGDTSHYTENGKKK